MRILSIVATALLSLVAGSVARADIITSLQSAPVAVDGGYEYTYTVSLEGGQLDAVQSGTPIQFGTVYDFGAYTFVGATGLLSSVFDFSFEDLSTPASWTSPADDDALTNIRFTYTGSDNIVVDGDPTTKDSYTVIANEPGNLGTFTVISPYEQTSNTAYDGQSYKGTNDTMQGNVGYLSAPMTPSSVTPEPSSLMLLGTGLLTAAATLRRRMA